MASRRSRLTSDVGNPPKALLVHLQGKRKDLIHALAGEGGNEQHRDEVQELQRLTDVQREGCLVRLADGIRSHLFTTTTALLSFSMAMPATWASWAATPWLASTSIRTTSARSIAFSARRTEYFSTPGSISSPPTDSGRVDQRDGDILEIDMGIDRITRVVPGIGETSTRSSPSKLVQQARFARRSAGR